MTRRNEILQRPPLPCPFCGSTNIRVEGIPAYCTCQNCFTQGPFGGTAERAVEEWNKRAPLEQKNEARP